jgi:hypothetical protein
VNPPAGKGRGVKAIFKIRRGFVFAPPKAYRFAKMVMPLRR